MCRRETHHITRVCPVPVDPAPSAERLIRARSSERPASSPSLRAWACRLRHLGRRVDVQAEARQALGDEGGDVGLGQPAEQQVRRRRIDHRIDRGEGDAPPAPCSRRPTAGGASRPACGCDGRRPAGPCRRRPSSSPPTFSTARRSAPRAGRSAARRRIASSRWSTIAPLSISVSPSSSTSAGMRPSGLWPRTSSRLPKPETQRCS